MTTTNHTDLAADGITAIAAHVTTPDGQLDAAIGNLAALQTTAKGSVVIAINALKTEIELALAGSDTDVAAIASDVAALEAQVASLSGGATVTNARLIEWTEAAAYQMLTTVYSDMYPLLIHYATVRWPDGSSGAFTVTASSGYWQAIDAYTVTHAASGKTITQPPVTRDEGRVMIKPALTVT